MPGKGKLSEPGTAFPTTRGQGSSHWAPLL